MKTARTLIVLMALCTLVGCSSRGGSAGLGALGGAAAGAGGYEYHLKRQEDKVEQDYKDGKITKSEYDIRIDQIKKDSVFR